MSRFAVWRKRARSNGLSGLRGRLPGIEELGTERGRILKEGAIFYGEVFKCRSPVGERDGSISDID